MRPTPTELIAHVRRILRDVIEPEVGSPYAQALLAEVQATLAQIDWDDAGLRLAESVGELRKLLLRCRDWIESDETRKAHFTTTLRDLAALPTETPEDFAGWNETRARCDEVVIALIDPLEDWLLVDQDDGTGQELRWELMAAIAR